MTLNSAVPYEALQSDEHACHAVVSSCYDIANICVD